ncbi:uncharacterized protein B0P05DRAFT_591734 [Gilbertella persicaria]|uniref:uncharacterized protein n=1 Tax=Gilbertella persicaria TaxID=101096 RepID=UPI00221E8E37|nr:uncharacterized protein B0P05DRAFT_591734 [Gilbertella persicaria]KAI8052561.1 hypothetical protein B0P05DRAFT_591734 [Gilbertella persicaria]
MSLDFNISRQLLEFDDAPLVNLIQYSIQQDCIHPSNFSDFTVVLINTTVIVTGGNAQSLQVWSRDLINAPENCWIFHESNQTDLYLPYRNGIGFKVSDTAIAAQAGDSNTSLLSNLSFFDLVTKTWSTPTIFQGTPPSARARMSVSLNTTTHIAYFYGGRTELMQPSSSNYYNAFYSFDINTLTWHWPDTLYSGGNRAARYGHSSNLISERLFIIGGKTAVYASDLDHWVTSPVDLQSVLIYDTVQHQAVTMAALGNIPSSRYSFSAVNGPDGKSIVLFGGQNASNNHLFDAYNDVYVLDTCTLNWSQPIIKGTPPVARAGHEAILFQDQYMVIMMGIQNYSSGSGPVYIDDTAVLDMNSWTWISHIPSHLSQPTTPPTCRFSFPVVIPDDTRDGNTTAFDPTVVSNTDTSPTTKQLALGITFGVLGFLLLATAAVIFILRIRKDVDATQNPRWLRRKKKEPLS